MRKHKYTVPVATKAALSQSLCDMRTAALSLRLGFRCVCCMIQSDHQYLCISGFCDFDLWLHAYEAPFCTHASIHGMVSQHTHADSKPV